MKVMRSNCWQYILAPERVLDLIHTNRTSFYRSSRARASLQPRPRNCWSRRGVVFGCTLAPALGNAATAISATDDERAAGPGGTARTTPRTTWTRVTNTQKRLTRVLA